MIMLTCINKCLFYFLAGNGQGCRSTILSLTGKWCLVWDWRFCLLKLSIGRCSVKNPCQLQMFHLIVAVYDRCHFRVKN